MRKLPLRAAIVTHGALEGLLPPCGFTHGSLAALGMSVVQSPSWICVHATDCCACHVKRGKGCCFEQNVLPWYPTPLRFFPLFPHGKVDACLFPLPLVRSLPGPPWCPSPLARHGYAGRSRCFWLSPNRIGCMPIGACARLGAVCGFCFFCFCPHVWSGAPPTQTL
jgi:hypothetical protein